MGLICKVKKRDTTRMSDGKLDVFQARVEQNESLRIKQWDNTVLNKIIINLYLHYRNGSAVTSNGWYKPMQSYRIERFTVHDLGTTIVHACSNNVIYYFRDYAMSEFLPSYARQNSQVSGNL